MKDGTIRTRSGDAYKPSAIRAYEAALTNHIVPTFGSKRLAALRYDDVQGFANALLAKGKDPSTVRNALMPLRVLFRRAKREVPVNPTSGLELPALRGKRDRIASPGEAAQLIAALPETEQALWAVFFYAGLRGGEVLALRFEDVDLKDGVITVRRSWDVKEGETTPKSKAGERTVPIPAVLREYIAAHTLRTGWSDGLVFGRSPTRPFNYRTSVLLAARVWKQEGLTTITPHEARHTFASLMIAAGVNAKSLSTYMGHSSITLTLDRYGHLMPGNEGEAAALLDAYLAKAAATPRLAQ
jgi:integrase